MDRSSTVQEQDSRPDPIPNLFRSVAQQTLKRADTLILELKCASYSLDMSCGWLETVMWETQVI